MGRRLAVAALVAVSAICACKAQIGLMPPAAPDGPGGGGGGGAGIDGMMPGSDAMPIDAPLGDFGVPAPVSVASSATVGEDDCTLSSDQLELYFAAQTAGNPKQLYRATRTSTAQPWGTPQLIFSSNNAHESPRLSPDDLTIYFGASGDIFYATRAATDQPWSTPTSLGQVNTPLYEKWFAACTGGYFVVSRENPNNNGHQNLYEGRLGAGNTGTLSTLSTTTGNDISTFLSDDCTTIYFASNRDANVGTQIYTATRPAPGGAWTTPALASFGPNFGTATDNEDPWLSNDGRALYFATIRNGNQKDVYYTTR